MNAEFPTLAEVLADHRPYGLDCKCGRPINSDADWAQHVAEVWREACTIRTAEQLDALPDHSIVRAGTNGHAYEKSMWGALFGRRWMEAGNASPERSEDIGLPALLLWHPSWGQS